MIQNENRKNGVLRLRLLLFGALILLIFLGLVLHLFDLQIVENLVWMKRAQDVARRSEPVLAQRGLIWDRNYDKPLAMNVNSFAVQIIPAELLPLNPDEIATRLADILPITPQSILSRLPKNWKNSWNPVEILDSVPFESIVRIAESSEEFPGVHWQSKSSRWYNEVGSISHLLGYVGTITTEELQILYNQGYANTASLGKTGVEKTFDGILRGKDGRIFRTVDVKGKYLDDESTEIIPPENGNDIVLTIDRRIQELAEKALGPRKGVAIVLKPSTGEILALVSYPSFDPNSFATIGPGGFKSLSRNSDFPLLNRALQSGYAPASTFKLVMTAAILGENSIDPHKTIECKGSMVLGNRRFWCHKRSGHGHVNMKQALEASCNIYFGTVGVKHLGIETISRYARAFGLGSLTGIEIDGEITGIVPDKDWKQKIYNTKWSPGDTLNTSVGQGFLLATPLQMANVVAGIVNKGVIYRPYLVSEIRRSGTGSIISRMTPEILRTSDLLDDEEYAYLQSAMRGVVTEGTGKWAIYTNTVDIAGKTGTGEIGSEGQWHDWFVSYGPYNTDNPDERIVVVILIEASDSYEWWAPKATDIIFEGVFDNQSYESVIKEWQSRKVWWSWSARELPKPGWPYMEKDE